MVARQNSLFLAPQRLERAAQAAAAITGRVLADDPPRSAAGAAPASPRDRDQRVRTLRGLPPRRGVRAQGGRHRRGVPARSGHQTAARFRRADLGPPGGEGAEPRARRRGDSTQRCRRAAGARAARPGGDRRDRLQAGRPPRGADPGVHPVRGSQQLLQPSRSNHALRPGMAVDREGPAGRSPPRGGGGGQARSADAARRHDPRVCRG